MLLKSKHWHILWPIRRDFFPKATYRRWDSRYHQELHYLFPQKRFRKQRLRIAHNLWGFFQQTHRPILRKAALARGRTHFSSCWRWYAYFFWYWWEATIPGFLTFTSLFRSSLFDFVSRTVLPSHLCSFVTISSRPFPLVRELLRSFQLHFE